MSDRPFIVGLPGLAGLSTMSQQQTIDAIEKAQPADPFGFIIFGGTTPDVATYPWLAKCVWLDSHVFKEYDTGTATWGAVTSGSILNTSQVADDIITPAKLSNDSASAFNILRTNGSNAPEWASLAAILIADTVPLLAINNTGADANAVLQSIGGVTQWTAYSTLAAAIVASITAYDIQKLTGKVASGVLITDGSSATAFLPIVDFVEDHIPDDSIPPAKIDKNAATTNQVLSIAGGLPSFNDPYPLSKYQAVQSGTALPTEGAANAKITVNHTLGVMPKLVRAVLVCTATDGANFVQNDEISIESLANGAAGFGTIRCKTGTPPQEIEVMFANSGATYYSVPVPGGTQNLDETKWALKLYVYA